MRDVIYRINDRDEITFVNSEYDEFALANEGNRVTSAAVVGQPLWSFVVDETTVAIYRSAVALVRAGRTLEFRFRCDSPARRRLMRMSMRPGEGGTVEFCVSMVATEERPLQRILDTEATRSDARLVICGWCRKLQAGRRWEELETALANLALLESPKLPELRHSICESCRDSMLSVLEKS